jgi:hypothetical protein
MNTTERTGCSDRDEAERMYVSYQSEQTTATHRNCSVNEDPQEMAILSADDTTGTTSEDASGYVLVSNGHITHY